MRELILGFSEIGSVSANARIAAEWYAGCLRAGGAAHVQIVGDALEPPAVVAGFPGVRRRPILQFVGRWRTGPFPPARLVDGRIVGRGLVRGMAELIVATEVARALAQDGMLPGGGLLLTAQSGPEAQPAESGALPALIAHGVMGDAVVLAGGEHAVAPVWARGAATFHASFGRQGQQAGAIDAAAGATLEAAHTFSLLLRRRGRCAARRDPESKESIVVRRIDGGQYPDSASWACVVEGDWHWSAGRSAREVSLALEEMAGYAARRLGVRVDLRVTPRQEPCSLSPHSTLVRSLRDAHLRVAGQPLPLGTAERPDGAALFLGAGVPALGYGIRAAFQAEGQEVVEVAELARLARIYLHLALTYLQADYLPSRETADVAALAHAVQGDEQRPPRLARPVAASVSGGWSGEAQDAAALSAPNSRDSWA